MPLLVPCARSPDGDVVFPCDADKQKRYTCFGCGNRLVVHKGGVRVHHFKHHAAGAGVACGGESNAHKVAKAFVAGAVKTLAFAVSVRCQDCDTQSVVLRGDPRLFVQQECRTSVLTREYRVDVSVGLGPVAWADIEICHTNPCHAQKLHDLACASRHGVFEVKASDVLSGQRALVSMHPRRCSVCASARLAARARCRAIATVKKCVQRIVAWRKTLRSMATRWLFSARNSMLLRHDQHDRAMLSVAKIEGEVRVVNAPAGGGKTTLILKMAEQCESALLLTFSKDLSRSISASPNVVVKTFDSACYSKTSIGGGITDQRVVNRAWPACKPWYKKKGGRGIADVVGARLQCATIKTCEHHSGDTMGYGINVGMGIDSFARSRYLVETMHHDLAAGHDHLFVDEYQDLTPQALRIILASTTPTTLVGDPNQAIFGFQNDLCASCGCTVSHPPQTTCLPTPVCVTRTFRSPWSVVHHLATHGVTTASSNKRGGFLSIPRQTLKMLGERGLCILVRSNSMLYEVARLLVKWHGRANVIGGEDTGKAVRKFARMASGRPVSPMHTWVRSLENADAVADFLCATGNGTLNTTPAAMVSTVHRAKGSEHKHVVLAEEFDRASEFEIWYVAHTRHTATLFELR